MLRSERFRPTVLVAAPVVAAFAGPPCKADPKPVAGERSPAVSALAKAEAAVAGSMPDHFALAREIDSAVITGRVDDARRAARELAAVSPSSYPAEWMPWLAEARAAARQVEAAPDLAKAADALGGLVAACGSCHAALGRGPDLSAAPELATDASAMTVHRWAAARMWEGVVGPSDSAWRAGTARFPRLPGCASDFGGELIDRAAIEAAREQVTALTKAAAETTDAAARATLYGDYVATCAACHATGC